jgi:biopolymer transport protein ExbD
MQFSTRKRRNPPTVIIVSLIDVLIVVLIFLMVASTFKQQQPALKLALPESKQTPKPGSAEENLIITIAKQEPYLYLGTRPVTLDKLQEELKTKAEKNPQITLSIRADTDAPFGQIVKVMDASKAAGIRAVSAFTKPPGQQ